MRVGESVEDIIWSKFTANEVVMSSRLLRVDVFIRVSFILGAEFVMGVNLKFVNCREW